MNVKPRKIFQRVNQLTDSKSRPRYIALLIDLTALIGIGWLAWYYGGFLLHDDLYLYGDHPGQFYRLWQMLTLSWPEEGRLISWTPHWHAGRPELQFYPPGFAFLGWLIWLGSYGQLSMVLVYQVVVFISYILPAIGFYLLMAWGLHDRLAGLLAAWLVLTFPFPLGGVQGVIIGIVGYHLGYALNPFLILVGVWGMQSRRKALAWFVAGVLLAAIVLLHPFQTLFPIGVLGLYALFRGQDRLERIGWLALVVLLALGLTAFWWLPLSTQLDNFIPVVEGTLQETRTHFENMWFAGMGWLLAVAVAGSFFQRGTRRTLALAILAGGAGMLAIILLNHIVVVDRFNLFVLDSVRLIPGVTFSILAGMALGVSELAWLGPRLLRRRGWSAAGWPLLLIVPWLFYQQITAAYNFDEWIIKWQPTPDKTPFFLREAEARYNLPAIWQIMAETPGRVLFTSAYTLLYDVPTSLKAVTPILTGREIVGGVFTLRSPAASYLWVGQRDPVVLRGKVEHQDDQSLAGVPWEAMTDEFLLDLARRFNITLIATTATDLKAQTFLDASAQVKPIWSNELMSFYEIVDYDPAWVEAVGANATVTRYARTAIEIEVSEAQPGAVLLVKVAHFPRWRADIEGELIPIHMQEQGLMELNLPPGDYPLHLRYEEAWPEQAGRIVSWLTLLGAIGGVIVASRNSFSLPTKDE